MIITFLKRICCERPLLLHILKQSLYIICYIYTVIHAFMRMVIVWKGGKILRNLNFHLHRGDGHTFDGWNPAPIDILNILLLVGFRICQVLQDFSHQHFVMTGHMCWTRWLSMLILLANICQMCYTLYILYIYTIQRNLKPKESDAPPQKGPAFQVLECPDLLLSFEVQ